MLIKCDYCGQIFNKKLSEIKRNKKNYCCMKCYGLSKRGINEYCIIDKQNSYILLKNNIKILIDTEDINKCKKYFWYIGDKGYAKTITYGERKHLFLHRYLKNTPRNKVTDHINQNKLDNRKINLKICNQIDNCQNKKNRTNKISGVSQEKHTNKFFAYIGYKGKKISLGRFEEYEQAVNARVNAEIKYYGVKLCI